MTIFFAAVDRRNASIPTGSQLASTEVHDERDVVEVPDIPTTTIATTTSTSYSSSNCWMWNQEAQAVLGLAYPKGLHPILLLLLHVD